ncbi:MAG: fused response regulator/phosphatase [Sneathiella sp.]
MHSTNLISPSAQLPSTKVVSETQDLSDCAILVVDDSLLIRQMISACLKSAGFTNITFAENGKIALDAITRKHPDIIILDLEMPIMNGFEFCKQATSNPDTRSIPILIQSGKDTREDIIRAYDLGAVDMIRKPIRDYELLARVRVHLENRVLLQKLTDYSSRVSQELAAARDIQQAICPTAETLENIKANLGLEILWHYEPSSELGGDIWGVDKISENKIGFFIADFSGHGVASALNTFRLHSWLSEFQKEFNDPAALMEKLNNFLCENLPAEVYATMLYGQVNTEKGLLTYSAAGTPSPISCGSGPNGKFTFRPSKGLPLGFRKDWKYENRTLKFDKGSRLFLYSDALVEATDQNGDMWGEQNLIKEIRSAYGDQQCSSAILRHVVGEFGKRNTDAVPDDLTILVLTNEG